MSNRKVPLYRIVFKGEISFAYDQDEVRQNLRRLCRFDEVTLDRLFSGEPFILKDRLPLETAQKYHDALDKTGALCSMEELPPTRPERPAKIELTTEPRIEMASGPRIELTTETPIELANQTDHSTESKPPVCPKCGAPKDSGLVCPACHIVYAKYEQRLARQQAIERGEIPAGSRPGQPAPPSAAADDRGLLDRMFAHFDAHQEQAFLVKALLTIVTILLIKPFLSGLFSGFLFLIFPFVLWLYLRHQAASTGQPLWSVLREHITFMPVMYAEGEKKTEGAAWVTYSLILVNILIFYGYELHTDPQFIINNLLFLPEQPTPLNIPLSLFSSFFLHANGGHLWGNMLFLWAVGTVVEKRIGWLRFFLFYLLCGIMAGLLSALVHFVFHHEAVHGLGASGAIAGVMGIFAVRCYFKSMVFPLPILGIFSLILPISLKVRLNSLVIIGLFFAMDLSGGIAQAAGQSSSNIGHWAHIGGMLCGVLLAMLSKLGEEAIGERHLEIGRAAMSKGGDLYAGEESMRLALQRDPGNAELTLMLGRLLSKYEASVEGEELFRKGMAKMIQRDPKETMAAYRDYYDRYMRATDPPTQLRLAAAFQQANDYTWASRCLELLADNVQTPATIRERAIFQCARIKELMGQKDVAHHYYRLFVDTFPQSPMTAKVQARLGTR